MHYLLGIMPQNNDPQLAKAHLFFERARKVAQSNNFDYAVDMYLEGLRCAPDETQNGHLKLREMALLRQVKGGKKPSMAEKLKRLRGKTPLDQMLNAEYLFAKDPDHLPYAEAMLKAAVAGDYRKTAKWIADLVFAANNAAEKPSFQTYVLLKDSYSAIGQFDRAVVACQCASRLKPSDGQLADEYKRLTAELTVSKGKYDQAGDFRDSIKDRQAQEKLQAQDAVVKTTDFRKSAVQDARAAMAKEPDLPKNIFNLAQALSELQNDDGDKQAIHLLEKAYVDKKDFSFKQRAGVIKINQLKRKIKELKNALAAKPDDKQVKALLAKLAEQLRNVELEHYRLSVENYPTDNRAKYEYGIRLIQNKQYDDAIPLFQEAQKDPRHKISSMSKMGLCFYNKGWFNDAADIFNQAMESYEIKDDEIAKELRYNLARSYERQNNTEKALEMYRKLAQLDFGYKDVSKRVENLRNNNNESTVQ